MKPASFVYLAPDTVAEACAMLAEQGEDAKVIAGGQSLVPAMNFRLARPSALIDIGRIGGLADVASDGRGRVLVGSRCRHVDLERNGLGGPLGTLLAVTARHIGHLPVRVRGTFGGSIAHADPSAEWCVLATALDATMIATGTDGTREIPASDFFDTIFTTSLRHNEVLTATALPLLSENHTIGVAEFARRAGDFAIVVAIAVLEWSGDHVESARIALGGVAGTPVRSTAAEALLVGQVLDQELIEAAGAVAADHVQPTPDIHGSAQYRKDLVGAMVNRALRMAGR